VRDILQEREERIGTVLRRYIFWFSWRILILVFLFILLEAVFRFGFFEVFGSADNQTLVYSILQKVLFTLVVWFGLAIVQKIIIPTLIGAIQPALSKLIREPTSRKRTFYSLGRYLIYGSYAVFIIAIAYIWAFSYVAAWVTGFLGTGLVITLTFVLGLFTSSVLGNVLAYLILDGTTEFKRGDRVQIGDSYGDIVELGFFFTRIKTIKDEVISVPNLSIMGKEVKNFSAMKAVLIYIAVTLGYDTDKDEAKRLLIESAESTKGIITKEDKKPFVLFRELGNCTVTYEINAYTDKPNDLINIKSELIDNILTNFKKANIEILSPTHVAVRNSATLKGA
jgi:small-conductance mechanosensitive channel